MSKMIPLDPQDRLSLLSASQLSVLNLFCDGLSQKEIAAKLFMKRGTVKTYMYQIYLGLGLMPLEPAARRKIIISEICPKLKRGEVDPDPTGIIEISSDKPDNLENLDEIIEDDSEWIRDIVPADTQAIIRPTKVRQNPFSTLMFMILGIAILFFIVNQFANNDPNIIVITQPPDVVYEDREVTVEVPVTVSSPLTQTPQVQQSTIVLTATLPPSTSTPEELPINSPGFVFTDDFEDGPDPLWEVKYGDPGMANGNYTIIAPFNEVASKHLSILNQNYWGDFEIKVGLSEFKSSYYNDYALGAIILRHIEGGNSIGLIIHPRDKGVQFGNLDKDGIWTLHSGSLVDGDDGGFDFYSKPTEIVISVVGNTYAVFIDENKVTSATIEGKPFGKVGFWFQASSNAKGVESYSPRFEYITIESLP